MCEKAEEIQKNWDPKEGDFTNSFRDGVNILFEEKYNKIWEGKNWIV